MDNKYNMICWKVISSNSLEWMMNSRKSNNQLLWCYIILLFIFLFIFNFDDRIGFLFFFILRGCYIFNLFSMNCTEQNNATPWELFLWSAHGCSARNPWKKRGWCSMYWLLHYICCFAGGDLLMWACVFEGNLILILGLGFLFSILEPFDELLHLLQEMHFALLWMSVFEPFEDWVFWYNVGWEIQQK